MVLSTGSADKTTSGYLRAHYLNYRLRPGCPDGVPRLANAPLLQQSGIRLHAHFNHNDLMHVVQMGAVWLLYEGGRRLRDANGR